MSLVAPIVAGSIGSRTLESKARKSRSTDRWWMPTTSALVGRSDRINPSRGRWGFAALRLKFRKPTSVCFATILLMAGRVRICGASLLGTATQTCADFWLGNLSRRCPAICPRDAYQAAWKVEQFGKNYEQLVSNVRETRREALPCGRCRQGWRA